MKNVKEWNYGRSAGFVATVCVLLAGGCAAPDTKGARSAAMSARSTAEESLAGLRKVSAEGAEAVAARRKGFDDDVNRLKSSADKHARAVTLSNAEATAKIDEMIKMASDKTRGVLPQTIAADDTSMREELSVLGGKAKGAVGDMKKGKDQKKKSGKPAAAKKS